MDLLVSAKRRVLNLTLNRPDKRNALTSGMCAAIIDEVNKAQDNSAIGCILISANGSVFSAGMDMEEAAHSGAEMNRLQDELFTMGVRSLKPIVIGVNGAALGGGLGLVAQGDVVLASERAVFGLPEVRIGLWPFFIYRALEAAIGNRRTLQASLTGHLFHPDEAVQWGLVHKVCPAMELDERVKVLARELAKGSPEAISAGLEYVKRSRWVSAEEAGKVAGELRSRLMAGADFKEGVAAFREKREPHWPSMPPAFYEKD
jgi:enoyl-CoA hydratase/carnithine racemase